MTACIARPARTRTAVLGVWLALVWAVPASATAQEKAPATSDTAAAEEAATVGPRTGDAWVDARLADIDRYAARHPEAFADELVRYRGAPRALVEELLDRGEPWSAGDIYFACALAQVVGRPCRAVVGIRDRAPSGAWADVAGELGAAPGSAPSRRLRSGIVESYRRWARPLPADAVQAGR